MVLRRPLGSLALLLVVIKSLQFAADSMPLFFFDSGAFILNGLGLAFIPERSYLYGYLLCRVSVPFGSLKPLVIAQVLLGGTTAWLLAFLLVRWFRVRTGIAALAALIFAFDPAQIVHERLVMAENLALFFIVLFLMSGLWYLRTKSHAWLVAASFFGIALVATRFAYLPVVLVGSLSLPIIAHLRRREADFRPLLAGLATAAAATLVFHGAYRAWNGYLAGREPAYNYSSPVFLMSAVAPILKPVDAADSRVATLIASLETGPFKLSDRGSRGFHHWEPGGLNDGLMKIYGNDKVVVSRVAAALARRAILRDPVGFLYLGLRSYWGHWRNLWGPIRFLRREHGVTPEVQVTAIDAQVVRSRFGFDVENQNSLSTLSRRFHEWARRWILLSLLAPFLSLAAVWFVPTDQRRMAGYLAGWNCLLMAALSLGADGTSYRYLHPYSFTGLLALSLLAEALWSRKPSGLRQEQSARAQDSPVTGGMGSASRW